MPHLCEASWHLIALLSMIKSYSGIAGGGLQQMHPNRAEHTNVRWTSSSNGDGSAMRGAEHQPHWDMKAWNWDGVMFVAQPVAGPSGGSALEGAGREACNENGACHKVSEIAFRLDGVSGTEQQINQNEDDESELRSRSFFGRETPSPPLNERKSFPRDEDSPEEVGSLSLKLGGESYSYAEENGNSFRNGKRGRSSSPQSQIAMCQVDECRADLSKAKDYHRRHKVCEMHSKAAKALVSRLMQRFCQQCSRFTTHFQLFCTFSFPIPLVLSLVDLLITPMHGGVGQKSENEKVLPNCVT